jgi:iron(II)-dependent oxidoreductase
MRGDLQAVRAKTLALVSGLDRSDLERQVDPLMSPLVWDLAHIAAYEDLWCVHRLAGRPLLRPDLAEVYDALETPRARRGDVALLDLPAALDYLHAVRERTLGILDQGGPSELHELALRHELQHTETMRQTLWLAGLPGGAPDAAPDFPDEPDWIELPAARFAMGAGPDGFAYDNERPRHDVDLPAFRIARTPLPVRHVSWLEATAIAHERGARPPTEAEWERAAPLLDGVGALWEWTATEFTGYPGFRAHPYREYSEPFFDRGYRVLRGGSWASSPRVATRTFRNWDLPERRQLFSGVRLAADAR